LILAFAGLLLLGRWPKLGRSLAWLGFTTLLLLSMPLVSDILSKALDDSRPLDFAEARTARAIVIPGGGVRRNALEYGGDTVGQFTLERVRYGAWIARRTGLPVLVSGGVVFGGTPAQVMRQTLLTNLVFQSNDGNAIAQYARKRAAFGRNIASHAIRRVLIAHGFDMRRFRTGSCRDWMSLHPP
jgi:uncharacterized SAM-binding protein YcdF (DUF218 family)